MSQRRSQKSGLGLLALVGVGLAYFGLNRTAQRLQTIEFNLGNPQFQRINKGNLEVLLPLDYVNPSAASVQVQNVFLKLKSGNSVFGTITRSTPFTLEAKADKTVRIPTTIKVQATVLVIAQAVVTGKLNLEASGFIRVAGNEFPVSRTFNIDLKGYAQNLINAWRK